MQQIINFWFNEIDQSQWWVKDTILDSVIKERFLSVHQQASSGELVGWRTSAKGRLAEIIVLDQFSRNMFRDTANSFASDSLALILSQEAINVGADSELSPIERSFLYMPFMHSESLLIHDRGVELFSQTGMDNNLDFELRHRDIIERFGRYPHRNDILGRESTPQEVSFLLEPGSSF